MKTVATVSTYGPIDCGWGHDTTTKGILKDDGRISINGGWSICMSLLEETVLKHNLQRGDQVIISVEPKIKKKRSFKKTNLLKKKS